MHCHLMTRLTAPREHKRPYDSPYRILYHPQDVHVQKQENYSEIYLFFKWVHGFFTDFQKNTLQKLPDIPIIGEKHEMKVT